MNGRSPAFLVLILLGVAGVSGSGVLETKPAAPAGGKETTTSTAPVKSTDVPACKETDPLQAMLRDYYTAIPSSLSDANIASVLIATVPDPSDARAAYRFDERLESLERAIQDAGYVVDRHCLPWSSTSGAESKKPSSDIKRPQDDKPGIVLFRDTRNQTNPCLLVLFLVGETPTFGAHKNALIEALDTAREIQPNRRDFQVIGPTFSGSAQSLRIAAEMWGKKWALADATEIELSFVTGSATVPGIRKTLSDDIPAAGPAHLKISFYSTIWDDRTVTQSLFDFLDKRRIRSSDVAILVEADSAYGEGISSAERDHVFSFPMHISQLRSVYMHDERLKAPPTGPVNQTTAMAQLSFDDAVDPIDLPDSASPGPTANLAELSLTNIIQELRRDRIRYVELLATDTRDKLFLAHFIRSQYPDVQFLTTESDLLFIHDQFNADLSGMIVASTYPLLSEVNTHQGGRQFPSQGAEGTYRAAAAVLNWKEAREQADSSHLLKQWDGSQWRLPSIWLTAVGRVGLWPIRILPLEENNKSGLIGLNAVIEDSRLPTHEPRNWFTLAFWCLTFFCLVSWGVYVNETSTLKVKNKYIGRFFESKVPTSLGVFKDFANTLPSLRIAKSIHSSLYFAILCLLYMTTAFVLVLPNLSANPLSEILIRGFVIATCLVMISAACREALRVFGLDATIQRVLAVVSVVFAAVVLVLLLGSYLNWYRAYPVALYARATRLESGLSPILPLFFLVLGLYTWLLAELKRIQHVVYSENLNPFNHNTHPAVAGLLKLRNRTRAAVCGVFFGVSPIWFVLAAFLWVMVIEYTPLCDFFKTTEGMFFDWSFLLLFLMLITGLALSAGRFFWTWYQMRRVLRRLTYHELDAAFGRLSPQFARALGAHLSAAPPTLMELQAPVEKLSSIEDEFPELAHDVLAVRKQFNVDMDEASSRGLRRWALASRTQMLLSSLSQRVLDGLCQKWTHGQSASSANTTLQDAEDFVAMQIVAFLSYVFIHLRYLLVASVVGAIALLLSVSSYPFFPQQTMINFSWTILLLLSGLYMLIFAQMGRNYVLSRIASKPTGFTLDRVFVSQTVTFGVLPVVAFLGTRFPALGRILYSWTGPLLKIFN